MISFALTPPCSVPPHGMQSCLTASQGTGRAGQAVGVPEAEAPAEEVVPKPGGELPRAAAGLVTAASQALWVSGHSVIEQVKKQQM